MPRIAQIRFHILGNSKNSRRISKDKSVQFQQRPFYHAPDYPQSSEHGFRIYILNMQHNRYSPTFCLFYSQILAEDRPNIRIYGRYVFMMFADITSNTATERETFTHTPYELRGWTDITVRHYMRKMLIAEIGSRINTPVRPCRHRRQDRNIILSRQGPCNRNRQGCRNNRFRREYPRQDKNHCFRTFSKPSC